MRKTLPLILLSATLFGCASTARIAVLENPNTKQTVECKIVPMGGFNFQTQIDNCVAAYKKAGYVLVADSSDEAR